MKLIDYFADFLKNHVNLDDARLGRLNDRVEAVTSFLQKAPTFDGNFIDTIPQGSFAHKTIIKPVQVNDEFDADLLLYVQEFDGWEAKDYVEELYKSFRESGIYREKVSRRTRCVTIDYAGDFHMDVVPFLERHDEKFITNRSENNFELTNPEGYNAWLAEQDRVTGRNLVKTIRLVKYLRDYKRTFGVKSVILNVLLGEQVNAAAPIADPGCYADVPTTLRTVMKRLHEYLKIRPSLPSIMDPSGTGENFSDRWDQDGYATFRVNMMRYAEWIDDAWSEPDRDKSLAKWQKVFGDDFQRPVQTQASESLVRSSAGLPVSYRNTDQKLEDLSIATAIVPDYRFRIEGKVLRNGSMGPYYLRNRGDRVLRGRRIRFQVAECNVPEPYKIYWKVRNRGPESIRNDAVRGQIEEGDKVWKQEEPADFIGPHYVECFIVRNGVCVAKDRQEVIII